MNTQDSLLTAANSLNHCHFEAALSTLSLSLAAAQSPQDKHLFQHWLNKAHFHSGDYLAAYEGCQALIGALTPDGDVSTILKSQLLTARCLNKMKDIAKAEVVCDDLIALVKEKALG
jgi:hypothetical protein